MSLLYRPLLPGIELDQATPRAGVDDVAVASSLPQLSNLVHGACLVFLYNLTGWTGAGGAKVVVDYVRPCGARQPPVFFLFPD